MRRNRESKSRSIDQLLEKIRQLEEDLASSEECQSGLRQTETIYKALFEYMLNGVGIYRQVKDPDLDNFILIDLNKAAERIDKIKKSKVIGQPITRIFPNIENFGLLHVFREVARTGKPVDHPVTRYKDERLEGWRDHFVFRLPTGEIVTVYSDETKRKQAEEALRNSEENLELWWRTLLIALSLKILPENINILIRQWKLS